MPLVPETKVEKLNVSQKQKVEIIKVLARKAKIIILDEPTAVLTPLEIKLFFKQLLLLREAGHTIIIITHKIKEIMEICDRVTVMKSGYNRGTYKISEVSEEIISKLMVGFEFKAETKPKSIPFGMPVLQVKDLNYFNETGKQVLKDINLSIAQNQILGIIGVEGSGQQELVRLLSGELKRYYGEILINNTDIKLKDTLEIRQLGVGYIPEDRMKEGVDLYGDLIENGMAIAYNAPEFTKFGLLKYKLLTEYVDRMLKDYEVKFDSHKDVISSLSGGNMQKIVCGREIDSTRSLLIANQPTRGIDIGSILAIHQKIKDLQTKNIAILLISSDLSEIYQLCKSVIVMFSGEIVASFDDIQKITEDDLGAYMLGLKKQVQKAEVH
jgi:simple sugar transport system ATP-binding protein